jgi:hypothetical protein
VLSTLDAVQKVVDELRAGPLKAKGLGIEQSYDSGLFIRRAVGLLTENLVVGALLALVCVWWFMRDGRATFLIASAIPICLLATFVVLHLAGRSLNVISLAGLAFAVGMVVEGAIVVSGNIIRLKESGMTPGRGGARRRAPGAARRCSRRPVTTIAVFVPVLFLRDVEARSSPTSRSPSRSPWRSPSWSRSPCCRRRPAAGSRPSAELGLRRRLAQADRKILDLTDTRAKQLGWIGALLVFPLILCAMFLPRLDYLPPVKRAAIDAFFNFPPGMSSAMVNREIAPR